MKAMSETLKLRWPRWADRNTEASRAGAAPAPGEGDDPGIEPTIYRFIIRHSYKRQLVILALTLGSFPFLYYSLSLPKTIINRAIGGHKFPQQFAFWQLDQIPYLLTLCGLFLVLVFINGAFKFYINLYKGQLGERMLRRLRYELYHRVLRFPVGQFKRVSAAEVIPMITAEVETLGGFIGDAFVQPVFQGGTLLTIIIFMFAQDPVLGAAAVALYPVQGYVIPKLQRRINLLAKQRVRTVRQVADRVGESAAGIIEIRANDGVRLQLAGFAHLLGTIYSIRFDIYNRKFFVKFLNNFIGQLTPFFFYMIGGYLVIRGNLSFGALVAVLAAYKDLASPWKELLDFYQLMQDSHIKYEQVIEQFRPPGLIERTRQLNPPETVPPLTGAIVASNVSFAEDERARVVDAVSFSLAANEHVAIVGPSNSGRYELALLLARLIEPTGGRITIGGADLAGLHDAVVGRRIGYASATPHFFAGSMQDNLYFSLRNRPVVPARYEPLRARTVSKILAEARQAGNIDLDLGADWTDYAAAGVADAAGLAARTVELLRRLDLAEDVYAFGLRGRLDPRQRPEVAERLLEARRALAQRLAADGITHLVEPFAADRYNSNASLAENLLFGTPVGPAFDFDQLASNTYVLRVLDKAGLTEDLVAMGGEVAKTMIELFADLPPEHEFFEQYSFIGAGDLHEFQAILTRAQKSGRDKLKADDRTRLLSLPFKLIAARHRLGLLDAALEARILAARRIFAADLPAAMRSQIEFFDAARYNAAATVQDNVLFGKVAYGEAAAPARIPLAISSVLDALGLRDAITAIGLDFAVGSGGSRLSAAQRQKAALARILLKRPDIVILNEATAALDGQMQAKVMAGIKEECVGRGLIWSLHRASLARHFDRVIVMAEGRIVEQGTFAELDRPGTALNKLLASE
ncbi:MAG TPA: ABC transporter transmembrane domain-containing protein [Stellaceae bacterium]|nr:ABC transporter transmembrane domain-containing protein [Stellaceae bacterium]